MEQEKELHQAVYAFLRTQIAFGFYGFSESLPTMEELSRQSRISLDTVKAAYHRLRREGSLSLSQKAGAKVAVQYRPEEIRRHVQAYFGARRAAVTDLSRSMWPLFGRALWLSLRHSPPETAEQMDAAARADGQSPNLIWQHLAQQYGALGNDLLMRLMRHIYLFFQGPFYSVQENRSDLERGLRRQQAVADLCRRGDWNALWPGLQIAQEELHCAVLRFYAAGDFPSGEETAFRWSAYQKSSQRCYSLAIGLLTGISRGAYPAGSYLPPAGRLAGEAGVSVSTVRRTISLLNSIGAVKSSRTLGACVLPPERSTENCDLTRPDIRSRLLDLTAGLQLYALSARAVSALTLSALDADAFRQWSRRLSGLQSGRRYELAAYASLELLSKQAPYGTIRTVYAELLQLFFWGNPLRGTRGATEENRRFFDPLFSEMHAALEARDIPRFSALLEALLLHELRVTVDALLALGIEEARSLLVPDEGEFQAIP